MSALALVEILDNIVYMDGTDELWGLFSETLLKKSSVRWEYSWDNFHISFNHVSDSKPNMFIFMNKLICFWALGNK